MKTIALASILPLQALAHFSLEYPPWRADSLSGTNETISQWAYPCANIQPMQNASQSRTPWPLTGGSLKLDLHHPWSYLFVNLGFGAEVTNFNVSLNPDGGALLNETGNGTFCWNKLPVPGMDVLGLEITDGLEASIQVVTVGDSGSALYNCADIVFSSNATLLDSDRCANSTNVSAESIAGTGNATGTGDQSKHNTTSSGSASSSPSSSTASSMTIPGLLVMLAVGVITL